MRSTSLLYPALVRRIIPRTNTQLGLHAGVGLLVAAVALAIAGCFPTQPGNPDASLRGVVVSDQGDPVGGAAVTVGATSAITGSDGRFHFAQLPAGKLEVAVAAGATTSFYIDPLLGEQNNQLTVSLGHDRRIASAECTRTGGRVSRGEAIHRLTRPLGAPDGNARGKVEVEEEGSGDEEFKIELDRLDPGTEFDVLLQHNRSDPNSMEIIGTITIGSDGEGELKFETEDGDTLPFGSLLSDLFGRRVEIRFHNSTTLYLEGSVPPAVPAMGGKREGELDLTNIAGPPDGEAEIKIKSKPRKHDERFQVEIENMPPFTTYSVCVECGPPKPDAKGSADPGVTTTWAERSGGSAVSGVSEAILSLPNVTAAPNDMIEVPVHVTTPDSITFASFVVEYSSAHMHFRGVVPGTDAASHGFTQIDFNNTPAFTPSALDSHVVVQISNPGGSGNIPGSIAPLEIVRLRFSVGNLPGSSAPIRWDRFVPIGLPRTFLEVLTGRTLTGEPALAFVDGRITITGGGPTSFDCVGTITTDDEGEGELKIKNKSGDRLPCGVEYVADLQTLNGGDRHVEVRDLSGTVIFAGRVPHFEEDDDDHHHDDD